MNLDMNIKNMKTIFLVRHGETDWNVLERFQGHIDVPLNENGCHQARSLIPVMQDKSIEAVLSSDLARAFKTGQIIAEALSVPLFQDPGLREACLGKAQGMTRLEMEKEFGKTLTQRWRSSHVSDADISYPGGETGNEVIQRVFASLEKFILSNSYSRLVVTTHGGVIRRVMQKLLPSPASHVPIPNGVVYEIRYLPEKNEFFIE